MQAMVIVTSGTNCDLELAQAFEDAGASCQTVQLHSILDAPEALDGAELVGLPGQLLRNQVSIVIRLAFIKEAICG